jgi:hypothetical protein
VASARDTTSDYLTLTEVRIGVDHTCREVRSMRVDAKVDMGQARGGEVKAGEARWQGRRGRGGSKVEAGEARRQGRRGEAAARSGDVVARLGEVGRGGGEVE